MCGYLIGWCMWQVSVRNLLSERKRRFGDCTVKHAVLYFVIFL